MPKEIEDAGTVLNLNDQRIESLQYASKIAAKVDNSLVQDSYDLYHHAFVFSEDGNYGVIQQGMNTRTRYARRYHWLSENVVEFVEEPHSAICCDKQESSVLDMTAKASRNARKVSLDLVNDNPTRLRKYIGQRTLTDFKELRMPSQRQLSEADLSSKVLQQLKRAYEIQPESHEELVSLHGVGAKTIRALAFISELIYGAEPSRQDPMKYAFTAGGKDGFPYPINKEHYDETTALLKTAIENACLNDKERLLAIKMLHRLR